MSEENNEGYGARSLGWSAFNPSGVIPIAQGEYELVPVLRWLANEAGNAARTDQDRFDLITYSLKKILAVTRSINRESKE